MDEDEFEAWEDELGAQSDDEVLVALRVLQGDGSVEERAKAAISLGPAMELYDLDELYDLSEAVARQAQDALWEVVEDETQPELVRRRALEALVRCPEDRLKARVRIALDTPGDWRLTGLFCAGFLSGFEADIRAGVASEVVAERVEAWGAAGAQLLHDLGRQAVRIAQDTSEDREVRIAAIGALETLKDDRGEAESVLADLEQDDDEEIAAAASAVGDMRGVLSGLEDF